MRRQSRVIRSDFTSEPPPPYDDNSSRGTSGFIYHLANESRQSHTKPTPKDLITLPNDIVSQIFLHVCQPILKDSNQRWERPFHPLTLGKVSRAWRHSAWLSSELWSTIIIHVCPDKKAIQTSLLQEWIDRANGRPLDIYIGQSPSTNPFSSIYTIRLSKTSSPFNISSPRTDLLALISKYLEQCQRIDLHVPSYVYKNLYGISRPGQPSYPFLRHFSLQVQESNGLFPFELGFHHAPLLGTLSFSSLSSLSMKPNILSFCPTKQITHLTLNSCNNIDLKVLLDQFPLLAKLTWTKCRFTRGSIWLDPHSISHLRLQALHIKFSVEDNFQSFFNSISLPALNSLSIGVAKALQPTDTQHIPPFLERSGCTLTHLTLECLVTAESEYNLIEFLSSHCISSTLKELCLRRYHIPDAQDGLTGLSRRFFDSLHPDEDPNYLAHLEVFEYEGPLAVETIDFIEPLIIRSRTRDDSNYLIHNEWMAVLRKATIKADQDSEIAEFLAEYTDPYYIWEVIRMMEEGMLVLVNMDGTRWRL